MYLHHISAFEKIPEYIHCKHSFLHFFYQLNKGRSASKDNLGILFPDEKKDIECSPRRKLPSIREHNSMEEESEEGTISSSARFWG